ncbi:MAG: DMT family transporter [Planctomycetes bacterium]|nr:DMT family transporter [Planctomycetota bacterium]
MKYYLVFPFLSSIVYVLGVMLLKQVTAHGIGVWRSTFISNLTTALVFALLWPFGGGPVLYDLWWQPTLVALLFIAGQVLTFLALEVGDVSVATPALGSKTIYVAWFSTLVIGVALPWELWLSAVLSFAAIALLNLGGSVRGRPLLTVAVSLAAAACYALFDVLIQKWSPAWSAGRFLPIMFAISAVLSFGFFPLFHAPLRAIPLKAWPQLGSGVFFIALQSLGLITTTAVFGDATSVNVIYSARGLWSVAAVWLIGHWFGNTERHHGAGVLAMRLAGAAVMTAAIIVTLIDWG